MLSRVPLLAVPLALAACGAASSPPVASPGVAPSSSAPSPSAPAAPPTPMRAFDTRVVSPAAGQPIPVLVGPFQVTAINPGTELALMISRDGGCADGVWFDYSGGGVVVPEGETLCARSEETRAQAFSGRAAP
jgi:ABC-type Fe3+-hydroxamate transport system substrate-binding protein